MAPPRRVITNLGERLRAAREALRLDQVGLGRRVFVSARQVSRWENGTRPSPAEAQRIVDVLSSAPAPVVLALADALGIELPESDAQAAPVAGPQPALGSPVVAPARPTPLSLRASFDVIILAAAEQRDVLPRHLRAFAAEVLLEVDRLGVSAREAAWLVAAPTRTPEPAGGNG